MSRKEKTVVVVAMLCIVGFIISVHQVHAEPRFAIASWSPFDEYGQGIFQIQVWENSTGSWVSVGVAYSESGAVFEMFPNGSAKIGCFTFFNNTLVGASSFADGQNYQRHNVTVKNSMGETVFSKQNFTYAWGDQYTYLPLWYYEYDVILDFALQYGEYYTVTVIYEILW